MKNIIVDTEQIGRYTNTTVTVIVNIIYLLEALGVMLRLLLITV